MSRSLIALVILFFVGLPLFQNCSSQMGDQTSPQSKSTGTPAMLYVGLGSVTQDLTATPVLTLFTSATTVAYYQAQILSSADNSLIRDWTYVSNGGNISGLSLSAGSSYYLNVEGLDVNGAIVAQGMSSAWAAQAAPTPSPTPTPTPTPSGPTLVQVAAEGVVPKPGYKLNTYDDFRGNSNGVTIASTINRICTTLGYSGGTGGEVKGTDYACGTTNQVPGAYRHNGGWGYMQTSGFGSGWCSSTYLDWVLCIQN